MSAAGHLLGAVPLPRGMVWVDEHNWSAAARSAEYSTTGALLVDVGVRQAGRPITLQAEDDAGWIELDALKSLRQLTDAPDAIYSLTLADGRAFQVMFAPDNPIEAHAVARPELPKGSHPYVATVRLIEV